ncbi:uncharacterized protein LOC111705792 [Eurytemora carolleeae]|uniref:uncharacterized protein LOC111705792 n=1 Tax=Eurytemora carolleeae TaxID=1294199 RepID=UPI000C78C051|nr:uncharacterized protein LOC111705792 [Eurytemora carolleeae]|eukprot:XP_023334227.1 uncharacterized protein LOC111705792 [Eurytemora affinis]
MQPEEGTNETVHRSFLPTINETLAEFKGNETLLALYKNITRMIEIFRQKELEASEGYRDKDESQAYLYILFVLMFYAFSIVILMVKYIRREREGHRLDSYYEEFVRRSWYTDKSLYDKTGRKVKTKIMRKNSKQLGETEPLDSDDEDYLENMYKNKVELDLLKGRGVTSLLAGKLANGLTGSVGITKPLPRVDEENEVEPGRRGSETDSEGTDTGSPDIVCRLGLAKDKETRNYMLYHRASLDEALELKDIKRLRTSFKQTHQISTLDDISSEDESLGDKV